jgi:hypothetical protein
MSKHEWSKPYCNVQHLHGLKRGFQVTVTDRDGWAECCVFTPGCGFNATETEHDSVDLAIHHGEAQAAALNALASEAA